MLLWLLIILGVGSGSSIGRRIISIIGIVHVIGIWIGIRIIVSAVWFRTCTICAGILTAIGVSIVVSCVIGGIVSLRVHIIPILAVHIILVWVIVVGGRGCIVIGFIIGVVVVVVDIGIWIGVVGIIGVVCRIAAIIWVRVILV